MNYKTTEKKDKYSYYQKAAKGGAIATLVGTMLHFSFAPEISRGYSARSTAIHSPWVTSQNGVVVEEDDFTKELQHSYAWSKLSLLMKVDEISHYNSNWDGDGADAPNKDAVENARNMILALSDAEASFLDSESIYASSYGSVILDFETRRGIVSAEIGDRSMGFYTDFTEGDNYAVEGVALGNDRVPDVLMKYLA